MNNTRRRDAARSRQALLAAAADLFAERGYAGTAIRSVGDRAGVDPALIARYFGGKEGLYQAVLAADPLIGRPEPQVGHPDGADRGGDTDGDQTGDDQTGDDQSGGGRTGGGQAGEGRAGEGRAGTGQAGDGRAAGPGTTVSGAVSRTGARAGAPAAAAGTPSDPRDAVHALVSRALDKWTATGVSAAAQNVFRREVDAAARAATRERLDTVRLPLAETAGGPDPELAAELAVALLFGVGVARDAGTLTRLAAAPAADLREPLTAALLAALGLADPPRP